MIILSCCCCCCSAFLVRHWKLVQFFLELLESPLSEVDKPAATKAQIAESLKTMAQDLNNGEKVCVYTAAIYCATWYRCRSTSYWMALKYGLHTKIRNMTCSLLMLQLPAI